jgi:bifunctional DNase/RNase
VNAIEVKVHGLAFDNQTKQHIVILKELTGERVLPIWIGQNEAHAIARVLASDKFPRPLTHDLLHLVVEGLKAKITKVVIADLRENTFFASIFLQRDGEVLSIDARPSDSIALALRAACPIFVNDKLLQQPPAEAAEAEGREPTEEERAEQLRRYLENLNPEDFGKFQL